MGSENRSVASSGTQAEVQTPSQPPPQPRHWLVWLGMLSLFVAIGLFMLSDRMAAARYGSASELWAVLGIDRDRQQSEYIYGIAVVEKDYVVYTVDHFHGSELKFYPVKYANEDLDGALHRLKEELSTYADTTEPLRLPVQAYARMINEDAVDLAKFLDAIQATSIDNWRREDPTNEMASYMQSRYQSVHDRWQQHRHVWGNYAFEWIT